MSRPKQKGKHSSRLNTIVLMLVAAVIGYCVLRSAEDKLGLTLNLPDTNIPGVQAIYDYLTGFGEQSRQFMDNAMAVSGRSEAATEAAADARLSVHMLDVGQAESILIKAPDKNVLIDAGDNGQGAQVLRYLKEQGVDRIHVMIATHPHADHIGGMDDVIRGMPVDLIIMPDIPDEIVPTTRTYLGLLNAIIDAEIEVEAARPGLEYQLGDGAVLRILGPGEPFDDLNELSVISKVTYGRTSFLFTGDAGKPAEREMLERGVSLKADVLNVGHHGSITASTQEFLEAVRPQIALISSGIDNGYGHPHRAVMERMHGLGVETYRTDLKGTVVVCSNGERLSIQTEK